METDVPVNTGENGNSTWLPDIMSSISTQQEETTFWDEVGTDWRTGVYILAGIRKFLKNCRKFSLNGLKFTAESKKYFHFGKKI